MRGRIELGFPWPYKLAHTTHSGISNGRDCARREYSEDNRSIQND